MREYTESIVFFFFQLLIISLILLPNSTYESFHLDNIQKIFSIIGSLSIFVALLAYGYKKNQDKTLAAIEHISFFRDKLLDQSKGVAEEIKKKNPNYNFNRIPIDEYSNIQTISRYKDRVSKNFEEQKKLILDNPNETDPSKWTTNNLVFKNQIDMLNSFEEFSLKVQHFKTRKHESLNSIKDTFVEIIEQNACALLYMRDLLKDNRVIYSKTLELYFSWKGQTKKPIFIINLEKYGFITKEFLENFQIERSKK